MHSLRKLVRSYSPDGLFLMETKASSQRLQRIGNSLAYENSFFIRKDSGGEELALLWLDNLNWNVVYNSNWIIGINTTSKFGTPYSIWFCYCSAYNSLRGDFWRVLSDLVKTGNIAWVCMGDFNDVLDQFEKLEGRYVNGKSHFHLRNFISKVGALDLGFMGNNFTWCNKKSGVANIKERRISSMKKTCSWLSMNELKEWKLPGDRSLASCG